MIYDEFYIPTKKSDEYKSCEDYLKRMKELLNIPNEVEEDVGEFKSLISIIRQEGNNYVITNDNFKKMTLLIYRIKANVPVIIMGETGCGKTALITKLNQLLNNGKITVQIVNIHPGINDKSLCEIMDEKDKKQGNKKMKNYGYFLMK
jgi:ABC-type bacteriocin/lantibiotic exporter with double-glycine peptidase domain